MLDWLIFHSKINPSVAGQNFHPILSCLLSTQDKTRGFHWSLDTLARNELSMKWYHCVAHFVYENELRLNPDSFYLCSPQEAMSLQGQIQRFWKGWALYVGHHGWPAKNILGFRWSKKAEITLETISFWQNISISIFKFSPFLSIKSYQFFKIY